LGDDNHYTVIGYCSFHLVDDVGKRIQVLNMEKQTISADEFNIFMALMQQCIENDDESSLEKVLKYICYRAIAIAALNIIDEYRKSVKI